MSGFIVQGPKSDYRDSSGLKNGLYPKLIISSLQMDLFCQAQVEQFLFISMYLINHVGSIYWYSFLFVILSKCIDEVKDYS